MKKIYFIFIIVISYGWQIAQAQPNTLPCTKKLTPCTALVLGGGGARGAAHVGVLKAIEESGIHIDLIVGTSMGSFVGGLFAAGKTADEIEAIFLNTDWNAGYSDSVSRTRLSNWRKSQRDEFQIHIDLGLDHKGIHLPTGLIQGQKMKRLIDQALGLQPVLQSFNDLPVAFRAVGADIENGEYIVLDHGDLASVMQISMSLPGILRPVEHNGRLLVDGGIAMNLPISVAKAAGAERIIAVDVGSPMPDRGSIGSGLKVMRQLSSLLVLLNVEQQKKLLSESDALITPEMNDITLLSFDKVSEAVEAGYRAGQVAISTLNSKENDRSAKEMQANAPHTLRDIYIDQIDIENNTRLSDQFIRARLDLQPNARYSVSELHDGIESLYAQGSIARVYSKVTSVENQGQVLNLRVDEKEWGPGYLDFKFSFEDDFHRSSVFQVGALYRRTNLTENGAEIAAILEVGTQKRLNIDFKLPFGYSDFYLNSVAEYLSQVSPYFIGEQDLGSFRSRSYILINGIGWELAEAMDIAVGGIYVDYSAEAPAIVKALSEIESFDVFQRGAHVNLTWDKLEDYSFPDSGWRVQLSGTRTQDRYLGQQYDTSQYNIDIDLALPIHERSTLHGVVRYHSVINDNQESPLGRESLGGFLSLSGNAKNFIAGTHTRFAKLIYRYKLASNNLKVFKLPVYLGVSLEAGNAWQSKSEIDYSDLIHSASTFLGWQSPIGPLYFGYGISDTGQESLYLSLGVSF